MIIAENVTKSLNGAPVLRGMTVTIPSGGLTAIVGVSGSGKTTFLSLLAGLDRADGGTLVVDGIDLRTVSEAQLTTYRRDRIGIVLQHFHLLPTLTALENVALTTPGNHGAPLEWLSRVGLADATGKYPAQLSGGMQQRVAIARALARAPAIFFADEPTGALDRESGASVFALLRELSASTTCVLVTHDPALAAQADRVIVMEDGARRAMASPGSGP